MDGSSSHRRLRAIIYALFGHPHSAKWHQQCLAHVDAHDYELLAVVPDVWGDDDRSGLKSGLNMLMGGEADVMVVASADHLPGDWIPRLEVAGDGDPFAIPPQNRPQSPPWQRRSRPLRRPHE